MELGLQLVSWLRESMNINFFVATHRVAQLFHAVDAPEKELEMLQSRQKIEIFQDGYQSDQGQDHTDPIPYMPHVVTKKVGSKIIKPKSSPKASSKKMDDGDVRKASGDSGETLEKVEKKRLKKEEKLAFAELCNGYTKEELEVLRQKAEECAQKERAELEKHNEGYYTPEQIQARIDALQEAQIAGVARDGRDFEGFDELQAQIEKEERTLSKVRAPGYDAKKARQEAAEDFAAAGMKAHLATTALEGLEKAVQAALKHGENPSEMQSAGTVYPSELPPHVAEVVQGATAGVRGVVIREMVTGASSERGRPAVVAKYAAQAAKLEDLAARMEKSAANTISYDGEQGPDLASTYILQAPPSTARTGQTAKSR